jgi:hypothetical protein
MNQITNQKNNTQNHHNNHQQNAIQKTALTSNLSIPTTTSYNNAFNSTHNQTHENPPKSSNQDIPESSNANQHQPFPQFSYYPENIVEEGVKACQSSILGKIISDKPIHVGSIQNGLDSIWGSPPGLKIQETEGKILQFFMDNAADQDRILWGNPWIFRNSWLVVKPWDRETDPRTLDFDHVPVWIQLWGLPPHCKTKAMGMHLGSLMGEVEAADLYEYPGKKTIIKIKVAISIHKPLPTGIHVGNPTDGTCWVDFRYEKLPLVCFNCGFIGHMDKLCRNPPVNMDTIAPMGPWIRSTQYGKRKQEIKDQKFYSNPSHSPDFGKYSPPVPASLLAKLADMKIQPQTNKDQGVNNNQSPQRNSTHRAGQYTNRDQDQTQVDEMVTDSQPVSASENEAMDKSNQAKRLKLTTAAASTYNKQSMAGLGIQASQMP